MWKVCCLSSLSPNNIHGYLLAVCMLKHFLAHMIRVLGYSLSESSSTRRYGFMYQELNTIVNKQISLGG